MRSDDLASVLDDVLVGRRLLEHPFYQRWEAGELASGELAAYAGQYRHFEAALPEILAAILAELPPDSAARRYVEANLADELAPAAHLSLFDEFVAAAGGQSGDPAGPACAALVETYRQLAGAGPAGALAALAAYEVQAGAVARSKADGLRAHYSFDASQTRFWDLHGELEQAHGAWTLEALAELDASSSELAAGAGAGAAAWWSFLDEREAQGLVGAGR